QSRTRRCSRPATRLTLRKLRRRARVSRLVNGAFGEGESMTVAVCLKCGEFKHGAWIRCRRCGYTPDDDESYTKHLLVTDHYLSREQLEEVADRIKEGERVEFPPEVLRQAWVSKADVEKANRGCTVGCLAFLGIGIVIVIGMIYTVWRLG